MKRRISFALVAVMIVSLLTSPFGFSLTANAQEITTEEQICSLFDELTENLALSMIAEDDLVVEKCESNVVEIEQQLKVLGVDKLSDQELNQFLNEKGEASVGTRISKPENTDTVKWYLYSYTNYSYNSKKYDVQRLIAVGNNPGGMLVTGADNVKFYSGKEKLANAVSAAVSIYVQKAIGSIPVIKWTPYELLFSNTSSNAFNSSYVTHRCVSSIAFSYVKESTQSDDYYALSFYSNKLTIAVNAHGAAVVDSVPTTYSEQKTETISADYYSSITAAIQSYTGAAGCYDYISYYEIQSYDGEYTKKAYVPTPLAGPGQIY